MRKLVHLERGEPNLSVLLIAPATLDRLVASTCRLRKGRNGSFRRSRCGAGLISSPASSFSRSSEALARA